MPVRVDDLLEGVDATDDGRELLRVEARPEHVWPWLVQLGFGRAGFYRYELIESLGRPSYEPDDGHQAADNAEPCEPGRQES